MLMGRTLTALTLGTSLLVHGNIVSGSRVIFYLPWIFKFPMPEVWRSVTSFWVTGSNLSILFDTYFCEPHGPTSLQVPVLMNNQVWTYSSGLEKESGRFSQPGDFFTYIIFLGLVILVRSQGPLFSVFARSIFMTFMPYPSLSCVRTHLTYLPAQPSSS